jgi:stage II sporulation protein AA (anti-sigma F factor antagonist)
MQKDVNFSELGEELVAGLSGELDHHSAKKMRIEIDSMLFRIKPKILALDFSLVRFMDSSGIGLIIGRADVCESIGAKIEIRGLDSRQVRILKLSGIEKIKGIKIKTLEGCERI